MGAGTLYGALNSLQEKGWIEPCGDSEGRKKSGGAGCPCLVFVVASLPYMSIVAGVIAQFGVFIAGAALAMNGHAISAGTLIAFVNLMNYVVNPIGSVPQYMAQCKASCALIDKLADALEDNVREEGLENKKELSRGITVNDLSFGYEAEKCVLQDVNFTFEAGKSYAIVGASGSGKSTLLNLLMASHNGYSGSICYDDTELRQISSESLYEMVSVVQQNVFIFMRPSGIISPCSLTSPERK